MVSRLSRQNEMMMLPACSKILSPQEPIHGTNSSRVQISWNKDPYDDSFHPLDQFTLPQVLNTSGSITCLVEQRFPTMFLRSCVDSPDRGICAIMVGIWTKNSRIGRGAYGTNATPERLNSITARHALGTSVLFETVVEFLLASLPRKTQAHHLKTPALQGSSD